MMTLLVDQRDIQFILFEQCNTRSVGFPFHLDLKEFQAFFEERSKLHDLQPLILATHLYLSGISYAKQEIKKEQILLHSPEIKRVFGVVKALIEASRSLLFKIEFFNYLSLQEKIEEERKKNYREISTFLAPVFSSFCIEKMKYAIDALTVCLGSGFLKESSIQQIIEKMQAHSIEEKGKNDFAVDGISQPPHGIFIKFSSFLQSFIDANKAHPTLQQELLSLESALDSTKKCMTKISEIMSKGEAYYASLQRGPFLKMSGYLVFGWLWLEQALIALPQLEALWEKQGAVVEETKFALCENDPEARFYEKKVKTARFYIWNLLPFTQAMAQGILSGDISAMKIRF